MLKTRKLIWLKTLLIGGIAALGLSFGGHVTAAGTSSSTMAQMGRGTNNAAQCQSACLTALPADRQKTLLAEREEDDDKQFAAPYIVMPMLGLLGVAFSVKALIRLASWRPPDLVLLYGNYLN